MLRITITASSRGGCATSAAACCRTRSIRPCSIRMHDELEDGMTGTFFGRAMTAPARAAAALFTDLPLTGEVNLLTSSSFDSAGQLLSDASVARGVAYVSIGAAAGQRGDWSVQGAMTQGDVSSWLFAGSFLARKEAVHRYEAGMAYSAQRYTGTNPASLASVAEGTRTAGAVFAFDTWTLSRRATLVYGGRVARYGYIDEALFSPRVRLDIAMRTIICGSVSLPAGAPRRPVPRNSCPRASRKPGCPLNGRLPPSWARASGLSAPIPTSWRSRRISAPRPCLACAPFTSAPKTRWPRCSGSASHRQSATSTTTPCPPRGLRGARLDGEHQPGRRAPGARQHRLHGDDGRMGSIARWGRPGAVRSVGRTRWRRAAPRPDHVVAGRHSRDGHARVRALSRQQRVRLRPSPRTTNPEPAPGSMCR